MPTTVATPSDVKKVQDELTALSAKHARLEAATAEAFASMLARVEALEARPVYVPPPSVPLAPISNRIMGMQIGAKNYDDPAYQARIAKLSLAVLAFPVGWRGDVGGNKIRPCVQAIKALNPRLRVAQYSNFVECLDNTGQYESSGDVARKLHAEGWWLRTASGELVPSRIQSEKRDVNVTSQRPDSDGLRFPQWHARRDYSAFFSKMPEFDIWYRDNANRTSRQWTPANWREDGADVVGRDDPSIQVSWRKAQREWWDECRRLSPGLTHIGNADSELSDIEYAGALDGAFLENIQSRDGGKWSSIWARYTGAMRNVIDPSLVTFHVTATNEEASFWLCAAMLGDGMFSLTEPGVGYSSVPWLPQYETRLGAAVDPIPPYSLTPYRRYQGGVVAVNAGDTQASISLPDFGAVSLPPKTGRILTTAQGGA
jgi:hypothetical protein